MIYDASQGLTQQTVRSCSNLESLAVGVMLTGPKVWFWFQEDP